MKEVYNYETVYGVEMSDRHLISKLLENEDFAATYLEYINIFNDDLLNMETIVSELDAQIGELVADDPTKFYTTEDYTSTITYDDTYDFAAETTSEDPKMEGQAPGQMMAVGEIPDDATATDSQMMGQAPGQMMTDGETPDDATATDSQMMGQAPGGQSMQGGQGSNGVDTQMGTTPLLNYAKERSEFITNQLAE